MTATLKVHLSYMKLWRRDMMESADDLIPEDTLVFSKDQIEYLRSEFERQRKWVNILSTREKAALEELELTTNSISFKVGRFLTWLPRKILSKKNKGNRNIVYFVDGVRIVEEQQEEMFPSTLLITPELLPDSSSSRKADSLIEEILIAVRRGRVTVNSVRDLFIESSFSMQDTEQFNAGMETMKHLLSSKQYRPSINNVYIGILRSLTRTSPSLGLEFGEAFFDELQDKRAIRTLVQLHGRVGNFTRPLELLKRTEKNAWRKEQIIRFGEAAKILQNGLHLPRKKQSPNFVPNDSILYYASQSMPHTTSGYAIRTHGLVSSLKKKSYDIRVVARHGYPLDRNDFIGEDVKPIEHIDSIEYNFSGIGNSESLINYQDVYSFKKLKKYQSIAFDNLYSLALKHKPRVIHSASNFVVGMAGANVAKALGIQSIYEIRGFWHLTQSTKREGYENSDHYKLSERFEIETAKNSDYVFTITNALKEILVENGVEENKIFILPNAIDSEKFKMIKRDKALEKELAVQDKPVIGYIGSFVEYEGLDLLLEACAMLKERHGDVFKLLLVGDGDTMQLLRRTSQFLQLEEQVIFTGRVPHDEVERYYSLIDIAPLPRKGYRVCELVSPLKPFEAMGAGKVLVTSSVRALAEIVDDGVTGLVFEKDNATDLAEKLELVLLDSGLRKKIGANANKWVRENHSWDVISKRVTNIYKQIWEEQK